MKTLQITREAETRFQVQSGPNIYHVNRDSGRWQCSCPARHMCKHLRTVLSCFGLTVGDTITVAAKTDPVGDADDGLLDGQEFDAEAGRDVLSELDYIRSGREKRNYGC